jgi:DNA-binding transcriptional LysR family regulator
MRTEPPTNTLDVSMIELRQIRHFLALCEHLHFGKAAESLHLTQPSLSRSIAALEAELGSPLFARHSRSVLLTAAGKEFQSRSREVISGLDSAIRHTKATAQGARGILRVSFTSLAAWTVLPSLMKRYMGAFPSVDMVLNEVLPKDLPAAVQRGDADVALTFRVDATESLNYRALHHEPLCAVIPSDHPLADTNPIDLEALRHDAFITFPRINAPILYDAVMDCCRDAGLQPVVRIQTHLQQTIVNLVAEGLGVSVVPASMRKLQLPGAVFKDIANSPQIEYGMVWKIGNDNPCLSTFLRHFDVY